MDEEIVLRLPEDIHKLCRTCMTVTENISCHDIVVFEMNKLLLAAEMLQSCTAATIVPDDGLPRSICDECASKLEIAYNYKIQCEQTEKNLREILNLPFTPPEVQEKSNDSEPVSIKREFVERNENIAENSDSHPRGIVLYANTSHKNFIDKNAIIGKDSNMKIHALTEARKNFVHNDCNNSNGSDSSSQLDILKLIEERKQAQNNGEKESDLEIDEINSLIYERKQCTLQASELSNEESPGLTTFIKDEIFSEDDSFDDFTCEQCYMTFTNFVDLSDHLQECKNSVLDKLRKLENESLEKDFYDENTNDNFPSFDCTICGIPFKTKYARNSHMSTHVPLAKLQPRLGVYTCDLCNRVFSSESKLATHFHKHAANIKRERKDNNSTKETKDVEIYDCNICLEKFDSEIDLNNHVENHKKPNVVSCEICNTDFIGEINLVRHLKKHGMQVSVCKICMKRFDGGMKLKEHMKLHLAENARKIFKCPICKEEYPSLNSLKSHSVEHLNETYECVRCKRTFNNKFSYDKHMKQHNEPRFLCSLCGKQYFSNVTLACHVRSHNNEKPFICPFCKKGFSSRATLSVHKRIHSSFKPYICNYCGYSCRQSGDLAMHIRTHTGDKPYKCTFPNCDRKFTTSSQRKEHYRRHTNERNHKCKVCEKAFLESKTLKVHMLTHTGEKPHECEVCGKKFRRTHHLANHMKGHKENAKT